MKNSKTSKPSKLPLKIPKDKKGSKSSAFNQFVESETLEHLLTRLNIKHWDFLIVGDGSGSNWDRETGWGSVMIEEKTMERTVWCGATNRGTVNLGEIMAYLQPLEYLAARESKRRKLTGSGRTHTIHIVTDSDYCRNNGNSGNQMMDINAGLWAMFNVFKRHGFIIKWHWMKRDTSDLNRYSDVLSKLARVLMKEYNLPMKASQRGRNKRSVYEINPESRTEDRE